MANSFSFNEISEILTAIANQATGRENAVAVDTGSFISLATKTLSLGVEPVMNAIQQVISKTIFSNRPYNRKFKSFEVTNEQFGNQIRKVVALDKGKSKNTEYSLKDGNSADMQKINAPSVLQTNIVGEEAFDYDITIFSKQVRNAFRGPEELSSFIAMIMQNIADQKEQDIESLSRNMLANLVTAKKKADPDNIIHLISEYNNKVGTSYTTLDSIRTAGSDKYEAFIKWCYARINSVSKLMTERSVLFHQNDTQKGQYIPRHSPKADQRLYIYGPFMTEVEAEVLSSIYNTNFLDLGEYEELNYWQAIKEPTKIVNKPSYLDEELAITSSSTEVTEENAFAVLMDKECMGISLYDKETSSAPYNAKGSYQNYFWHETAKYWTDFTENAVVFVMD